MSAELIELVDTRTASLRRLLTPWAAEVRELRQLLVQTHVRFALELSTVDPTASGFVGAFATAAHHLEEDPLDLTPAEFEKCRLYATLVLSDYDPATARHLAASTLDWRTRAAADGASEHRWNCHTLLAVSAGIVYAHTVLHQESMSAVRTLIERGVVLGGVSGTAIGLGIAGATELSVPVAATVGPAAGALIGAVLLPLSGAAINRRAR